MRQDSSASGRIGRGIDTQASGLVVLHIFDKTSGRLDKPAACQPLAGGYASLPGTVSCGSMTLVLGNERHHRTETATYTIPEGWQHRHIAGIPPGCVGSVLEIENKDLS